MVLSIRAACVTQNIQHLTLNTCNIWRLLTLSLKHQIAVAGTPPTPPPHLINDLVQI